MPDYLQSPTFWLLFVGGFGATFLLVPMVIRLARVVGAVDRGGHRKIHQGPPMPLMGGLAIAIPFIAVCLFSIWGGTGMTRLLNPHQADLVALAIGCVAIVGLGIIDDMAGLGAARKFAVQILVALIICVSGNAIESIQVPLLGQVYLGPTLGGLLTVLWIVGLTNAYNLIDGIDGLAAGLALIGSFGLALFAILNGNTFAALLCISLCGSLLAFLFYNFQPARIFLGDTGSMFLGFALANIMLMSSMRSSGTVVFLAPLLILGLPIVDTATAMSRRFLRGRPIFSGDQGHIHHRLLRQGHSHRSAVLVLYGFAAAMTIVGIVAWLLRTHWSSIWVAAAGWLAAAAGLFWIGGYFRTLRPVDLRQCRERNILLTSFARYATLKLTSRLASHRSHDQVLRMICREMHLTWLEVSREDGTVLLSSPSPGDQHAADAVPPDGPLRQFRVQNLSNGMLSVRYRHEPDLPDDIEPTDVESCLAGIFEKTHMHQSQPESALAAGRALKSFE